MTTFPTFSDEDFDVFHIPGLEPRMDALIATVRPKLFTLGDALSPYLSTLCGEEMFPHVAKHARRKVHPPNDTWVAWAPNKRGYKAHPHFQVGLWSTHVFVQFAIIYECENKNTFARHLSDHLSEIQASIPNHFFWSIDHMQPETTPHAEMSSEKFDNLIHRLEHVKKSEVLCGLEIRKDDPVLHEPEKLHALIEDTFLKVVPLYRLSF
ncbi:YktB family protein [Paenibacillus sp. KN14-4R]|uniref:YktB family protein n=1 Tax=Paenibacillus sp. KN14-4R TaxID=3445773 RepID=UPI003F9F9365